MTQPRMFLLMFMLFAFCGCQLDPGLGNQTNSVKVSKMTMIEVNPNDIVGPVNPLIFGTNMIAYEPSTFEVRSEPYYGYSNYGAGIWNPDTLEVNAEAAAYAKETGVSIARFPGGCGAHRYDWKHTVLPVEFRPNYQYGLDEFMKTCEVIGSKAIITLSYYIGSSQDAADLVEYLNSPNDGSNPGGGEDWASIRAANGREEPYGVVFFEFGNEEFHGDHSDMKIRVSGIEYGRRFIEYSMAMKSIDPSIKLGAVTINPEQTYYAEWNGKVFATAGQHIDFLIEHTYDAGEKVWLNYEQPEPGQIDSIYRKALDGLAHIESYYRILSIDFEKATGRKNIPIAVTEYNAHFIRDSSYPYRHTLGTALFNAGLIQIFMRPENNILLANYWQFINSSWGIVKNDSFMNGTASYAKRPNFYVLKLFKEHFGKKLLSYHSTSEDLLVSASLSEGSKKIYLMVINKNMKDDVNAKFTVKKTNLAEDAHVWTLNGPAVDSINETVENVKIEESVLKLTDGVLDIFFQPHSLTFIELAVNHI